MFSENLKKLRKANNLTQREFAKKINVAVSTVSMWELGQREPGYDMLIKLSDFFDVEVSYLIGLSDDPTPANKKETPELYPGQAEDLLELQSLLESLDEKNLKIARKIIKSLGSDTE